MKEFNDLFKIYKKESFKQSIIKSLILSSFVSLIGFIVVWFLAPYLLWSIFIVFGLTMMVSLAFRKRVTYKSFSKYLDSLGLQERVITMNQLANDTSLMARIQREDTKDYLRKISKDKFKIPVSALSIVLIALLLVFNSSMVVVNALANQGKIGDGSTTVNELINGYNYYELTYDVASKGYNGLNWVCDCGIIDGDAFQVVKEGEDSCGVLAVADDGYMFITWSDGVTDSYRKELNVQDNEIVYALFVEIDDPAQMLDELLEDFLKDNKGEPLKGEANIPKKPIPGKPMPGSSDDGEGGGAGGRYVQSNQVIDGETYYGDEVFDNAFAEAMEKIQNSDLSDEEKQLILDYFKTIAK